MSFAGRLARGLLSGAAGYYTGVAQEQLDQRKQQALLDREKALASFQSELTEHRDTVATRNNIIEATATLPAKTDAQIRVDQAKEAAAYARWKLQFPQEQRAKLTLEQFQQEQETGRTRMQQEGEDRRASQRDRTERETHPIATTEAADGTPVISFAPSEPGGPPRTIKVEGAHSRRTGRSSDDEDYGLGGSPAPRRSAPAPAPDAGTSDTPTFDQILADASMSQQMRGKSAAEIRAAAISVARAHGIPAPAR